MNISKYEIEDKPVDALYRVMQMRHKIEEKKPEHEWLDWLIKIENTLRWQREQMQKMNARVKSYQHKVERLQNFTSLEIDELSERVTEQTQEEIDSDWLRKPIDHNTDRW
jgi:hypothetical protein